MIVAQPVLLALLVRQVLKAPLARQELPVLKVRLVLPVKLVKPEPLDLKDQQDKRDRLAMPVQTDRPGLRGRLAQLEPLDLKDKLVLLVKLVRPELPAPRDRLELLVLKDRLVLLEHKARLVKLVKLVLLDQQVQQVQRFLMILPAESRQPPIIAGLRFYLLRHQTTQFITLRCMLLVDEPIQLIVRLIGGERQFTEKLAVQQHCRAYNSRHIQENLTANGMLR